MATSLEEQRDTLVSRRLMKGIFRMALSHAEQGIPMYAPQNTGESIQKWLAESPYDQREDARNGDPHYFRMAYTAIRWLMERHDNIPEMD